MKSHLGIVISEKKVCLSVVLLSNTFQAFGQLSNSATKNGETIGVWGSGVGRIKLGSLAFSIALHSSLNFSRRFFVPLRN